MCVTQKQVDEGSWPMFTFGGKTYFSVEELRSNRLAFKHFHDQCLAFKAVYDNLTREFELNSGEFSGQVHTSLWLRR